MNYVKSLYLGKDLQDLLLEEVEFSQESNQWLVTIGFSLKEKTEEAAPLIVSSTKNRLLSRRYKVVEIDAKTGEPISMKIRVLQ